MNKTAITLTDSPRVRTAVRVLGALLLVLVGADHYYEYAVDDYSVIPTIGTLFLLNFVSATALGLLLLVPLERLWHRLGKMATELAAVSGLAVAASSLTALLISEHTSLFGFMESNYRPAIVVAIAFEAGASVVLAALLGLTLRDRGPARRTREPIGV